jgi:hypothetical protein
MSGQRPSAAECADPAGPDGEVRARLLSESSCGKNATYIDRAPPPQPVEGLSAAQELDVAARAVLEFHGHAARGLRRRIPGCPTDPTGWRSTRRSKACGAAADPLRVAVSRSLRAAPAQGLLMRFPRSERDEGSKRVVSFACRGSRCPGTSRVQSPKTRTDAGACSLPLDLSCALTFRLPRSHLRTPGGHGSRELVPGCGRSRGRIRDFAARVSGAPPAAKNLPPSPEATCRNGRAG